MSAPYVVVVGGLSDIKGDVASLPDRIRAAAKLSINSTLRHTRTAAAADILAQVNFGAAYLNQDNRLAVTRFATDENLSGVITGRSRPTSLARFATQTGKGISIQVKPGSARFARRAFFIKLRQGAGDIETKSNLGLAIRLKPGESVTNKKKLIKLSGNLYLLYGPSVDQVFADVAEQKAPDAALYLEKEFIRLLEL